MAKNTLFKELTKTYLPGDPGIPANPGRPYLPPRTRQITETQCTYGPDYAALAALGVTRTQIIDRKTGQLVWIWTPPPGVTASIIPYVYACEEVTYSVEVPAQSYIPPTPGVPATEAKVIQDFKLGWNARSRSIKEFPGAVVTEFKVPRTAAGMVVGLNTEYHASGYADIKFAFYVGHGLAHVMESGVQKASIGAYADEAVFKIRRLRGKVTYLVDDVQVWESDNTAAPFFLDAAIYVGGDTVYDPAIAGLAVGDGVLLPLSGAGGVAHAFSAGSIGPLTSTGGVFYRSDTVLLPLTGLGGDYPYATSVGVLPPLAGEGSGADLLPGYAIADSVLVPFSTVSSGFTGQIGGGATLLSGFTGLSSEGIYGDSRAQLHPITGLGRALSEAERSTLVMFSKAGAGGPLRTIGGLVLVLNSAASAISMLAVTREAFLSLVSEAAALSSLGVAGRFSLELFSALVSRSMQGEADGPGSVWVVNAETGATTRYENFDFNSYAKIGANYFGCKADGIYQLDGDTDSGEPIRAMVSFGKQNFGTSALKRITNAYVGVSGQGRLFLKVLAEGQEYTYAQRGYDEQLQVQRFDTGKGLRVNWLEFELYNADGEDFELASVEFAAVPLSRRI